MTDTMTETDRVAALTAAAFEGRIETPFKLISGDISMDVQLMTCRENPDAQAPDCVRMPFTLLFRADEDAAHPMQQAREFHGVVHGLDSGPLPPLHICRTLRPVRMPTGAYYQVVFN